MSFIIICGRFSLQMFIDRIEYHIDSHPCTVISKALYYYFREKMDQE